MNCAHVIDSQFGHDIYLSFTEVRRLNSLLWCDPGWDEVLRAISVHKRVCPVIVALRERKLRQWQKSL